MKNQNEQFRDCTEAEKEALKDQPKPEGLTPEQSQRWDDVEHDLRPLKNEGVFCKGV